MILSNMPEYHKDFLRSFYRRDPQWDLLNIAGLKDLSTVRWRELNLDNAGKGTKEEILQKLEEVIGQ